MSIRCNFGRRMLGTCIGGFVALFALFGSSAFGSDVAGSWYHNGQRVGQFEWEDYGDKVRVADTFGDGYAVSAMVVTDRYGVLRTCSDWDGAHNGWSPWCSYWDQVDEGARVSISLMLVNKWGSVVAQSKAWTAYG